MSLRNESKLTWTSSSLETVSSVLFLASKPNLHLASTFGCAPLSAPPLKDTDQSEPHRLTANHKPARGLCISCSTPASVPFTPNCRCLFRQPQANQHTSHSGRKCSCPGDFQN